VQVCDTCNYDFYYFSGGITRHIAHQSVKIVVWPPDDPDKICKESELLWQKTK